MKKMTKLQSSPFTVPDWVKWTAIITSILFVLGLSLSIWIYIDVYHDRTSSHAQATTLVLEKTELETIDDVSVYHGKETVHIMEGAVGNGRSALVYVQVDDQKVLNVIQDEDYLSISEMKDIWKEECDGCAFRDIQYGYEEGEPVFEITYIDQQDRYVFNYYGLDGQSFDQRFAFKQNQ
ncbi:DUF5590 domain-containing protein [Halobacillus locisalis]|uniref:DUF5590 domain-containing protein n=1 Tax=Halobacillus locisalis TaxID=220753 RepID=A0A838CQ73_9BACI|nr:DUF5590 domain-containing protein [Halobacillus locisalis]MBA2173905.1 DUF5590 domain-containing protein [Halobacillus locisalis]